MALIDAVRPQIGVFYSTPEKDAEIAQVIDGAIAYFNGAGWKIPPQEEPDHSPTAIMAIITFCKLMMFSDLANPADIANHPTLIALIAQQRGR